MSMTDGFLYLNTYYTAKIRKKKQNIQPFQQKTLNFHLKTPFNATSLQITIIFNELCYCPSFSFNFRRSLTSDNFRFDQFFYVVTLSIALNIVPSESFF